MKSNNMLQKLVQRIERVSRIREWPTIRTIGLGEDYTLEFEYEESTEVYKLFRLKFHDLELEVFESQDDVKIISDAIAQKIQEMKSEGLTKL